MLRFCDNEVSCVLDMEMDRHEILDYFFQGHMDDIVCVFDIDGNYKGRITYYALINTNDISDAVQEDCVVLDQSIWQNARNYFSHYKSRLNEHVLLPVVDKAGKLLCFAYEDPDANREIRMLRELSENSDALQFSDVYPQYTTVKIYEFNELAYFFAKYLESQNINVQVAGELWDGFFEETEHQELADKCMTIYAEGTGRKKADWVDNLLESVCVEFECIDRIYEANIKNQVFLDACGGIEKLLRYLENKTEIAILGSGREAQDVYDFLTEHHIDICCFVNENYGERSHRMFGKEILSSLDARMKYENPVFIECVSEHSAWGFGGVDNYDYMGYKRNESYFLIRDYIDVSGNSILNILKKKNVLLVGDHNLCSYLYHFFSLNKIKIAGCLDVMQQNDHLCSLIKQEAKNNDLICLIAVMEFFEPEQKQQQEEVKKRLKDDLKKNGLEDYTDYFSYTLSYIEIEQYNPEKYMKMQLMPKRIVIGSVETSSGNAFFRGLLDGHPSVGMLDYRYFNERLFWYCIRLSVKQAEEILPCFWKICENECWDVKYMRTSKLFCERMESLLRLQKKFTSQELFVMFHIAYMYMRGQDISKTDIKKMVIYWEPHYTPRVIEEEFVKWLGMEAVKCDILNIVRNIVMHKGAIKMLFQRGKEKTYAYDFIIDYPSIEKKVYLWGKRLVIKFEDLKSRPQETLSKICSAWEIGWSKTLMKTTHYGKQNFYDNGEYVVNDFDLKPVYNTNEKYFSEFDRLRMILINAPWQRKYGYPYVKITSFTGRELQEMFSKRFRFEDEITFADMKMEREFKIGIYHTIRYNLQKVRMLEILNSGTV